MAAVNFFLLKCVAVASKNEVKLQIA